MKRLDETGKEKVGYEAVGMSHHIPGNWDLKAIISVYQTEFLMAKEFRTV